MTNDEFLPTTANELHVHHWNQPDVILVSGDSYIDSLILGLLLLEGFWRRRVSKWRLFPSRIYPMIRISPGWVNQDCSGESQRVAWIQWSQIGLHQRKEENMMTTLPAD